MSRYDARMPIDVEAELRHWADWSRLDSQADQDPRAELLNLIIDRMAAGIGQECMTALKSKYLHGLSDRQIAAQIGKSQATQLVCDHFPY